MLSDNLRDNVLQTMVMLKNCTSIDPNVKHTKNDSPKHILLPCVVTKMACKSRRDSGCKLLCRCVRHITDVEHTPKRSRDANLVKIKHDNKGIRCLELSCDVPASMKQNC